MIKAGLIGANGRLGSVIKGLVEKEFANRFLITASIGKSNQGQILKNPEDIDVFIDVSFPDAAVKSLQLLLEQGLKIPYIIGCTGWSDEQMKTVQQYSRQACVVNAPNFSPGVNLFLKLIEQAAPLLKGWGYDAIVHEIHHTRKKDAPSGTAKAIIDRMGDKNTQVHSSRAGNTVGTHEVKFVGPADTLTFTHEALDRSIFARGALLATEWSVQQRAPGLYSMQEVLFQSGKKQ